VVAVAVVVVAAVAVVAVTVVAVAIVVVTAVAVVAIAAVAVVAAAVSAAILSAPPAIIGVADEGVTATTASDAAAASVNTYFGISTSRIPTRLHQIETPRAPCRRSSPHFDYVAAG
jgi:hypothetical protein